MKDGSAFKLCWQRKRTRMEVDRNEFKCAIEVDMKIIFTVINVLLRNNTGRCS